jgi:threonine dehydrogenase-like Zn-dependent dehydrogenase
MNYDIASIMDTLSIALHMIERTDFRVGDDVLVNGAGAQGWMSIICLKTMGANKIYCSGSGKRLEMAAELGAIPINYREEDIPETIMKYTNGAGVKRVVECTGTAQGVQAACWSVARGGSIAAVGFPKGDVPIPVRHLVLDEISFNGSRANPNTLEPAITIAAKHMDDLQKLITHVFPMSKYAEAYEVFTKRLDNSLKVVVKPQE